MFHVECQSMNYLRRIGTFLATSRFFFTAQLVGERIRDRTKNKSRGHSMTKTFTSSIFILTVVLGACGAQAMTSVETPGKAVEPQGRYLCASATWPRIPAMCLEGGSGHEVRYASTLANEEITLNIANRLTGAF
jgi:hypothetical protein